MDDTDTFEPFRLPDEDSHPATIAARLMRHPVHQHLGDNDVSFGWLMRMDEKRKGGKVELGSVHAVKTMAQGGFKDLFLQLLERMLGHLPEFIVVINHAWWEQATDEQRRALVWHELAHVKQALDKWDAPRFDRDGLPVWAIVSHDLEAFRSELVEFGAWREDIADFLNAARTSGA